MGGGDSEPKCLGVTKTGGKEKSDHFGQPFFLSVKKADLVKVSIDNSMAPNDSTSLTNGKHVEVFETRLGKQ